MTETMWAAQLTSPRRPLELMRVPVPRPGAGELLVKIEASGICHTDLHVQEAIDFPAGSPRPLTLGHEGIGRVVAQGPGAGRFPVGSRVGVPWLHDSCDHCRQCLTGWESFCASHRAHGYSVNGAFAEFVIVKERFAAPIPDALDSASAAPLMCAGVTAFGAVQRAEIGPGKTCVVFGCGGLGQYAIQLAKLHGASVIAVDALPGKLAVAKALGADEALLADAATAARIRSMGGADACINFAPTAKVWPIMTEAINPFGWIISVAMVAEPVPLVLEWLTYNGVRITGASVGTRQQLDDLLQLASKHDLKIEIERIRLPDINKAFARLSRGEVAGRFVIDFAAAA